MQAPFRIFRLVSPKRRRYTLVSRDTGGSAGILRTAPPMTELQELHMQKEIALTAEGQARLEEELLHLETVRRREVGERIREAKEFGDISENSEYDDAKNEQAWVESRIAEISQILSNATIIESPKSHARVTLGSRVHLKDLAADEVCTYQLVGSAEADPLHNRISNESPVGQAVIGARKGDTVRVTTPRGSVIEYEVVSITK